MKLSLNGEDIAQIIIGASVLAVPISFSEEAWTSAINLPLPNLFLVFLLSIGFLALYAYQSLFQASIKYRMFIFIFRVVLAYLLTAIVVGVVLLALDKLPLLTEPIVAIKRIILVAMPASMGAIVVDSFDKE
ncbi:MAG: DUF2391 family protein [Desulfuromusa sp.]|jgi:uncharacterized membrane protein|nr:DUF2391 family protein [Desulfuromusa sp.]